MPLFSPATEDQRDTDQNKTLTPTTSDAKSRTTTTTKTTAMSNDIPYDVITELKISLRKQLNLPSSYTIPSTQSLPNLPSFSDSISQIDQSPTYLRCKNCKGRLLRGINSIICVFCGKQQHDKDVGPEPIKFMSTFGCRWFLESLGLDGSELVKPVVEANELNRGRNALQNEFPLSDFLDLEIRWTSEFERLETSGSNSTSAQKLSTLNLAGVDLDNFFAEPKVDSVPASSESQFTLTKQNHAMGHSAVEGHGSLSLFENVQNAETIGGLNEDESGGWSSGWDAEFQSASSGTQHQESKPVDPFVGSSSVDLSAHMDSVFGSGKDIFSGKTIESTSSLTSNANDWFKDDPWNKSNTRITGQDEQFKVDINEADGGKKASTNDSQMNIDWMQDNQWQTSSSRKAEESKIIDEDDDSFDAWNDFTGSTTVEVPSNNSSKQDVTQIIPSTDQALEINLFGGTSNSRDVDFGSFSEPDFFSGTSKNQNGSSEANIMQMGSSFPDRIVDNNEDGRSVEGMKKGENSRSKADDVEMIMSQMHDLSFMLESNLSVPQKTDPFSPFPKD